MIRADRRWWCGIVAVATAVAIPSIATGGDTVVERYDSYQAGGYILSNPAPADDGATVWDSLQLNMWQVVADKPADAFAPEYGAVLSIGQTWTSEAGNWGGGPTCYTDHAYGTTLPPESLMITSHGAELDAIFYCNGWWPQTNEWVEFTLPVHLTVSTTGRPFSRANGRCFDWDPGHVLCRARLTQTRATASGTAIYNGINYAGGTSYDVVLIHWENQIVQTP